jgi:hypothetical protein
MPSNTVAPTPVHVTLVADPYRVSSRKITAVITIAQSTMGVVTLPRERWRTWKTTPLTSPT